MSHELRTPLNAVIGFSEVLLDRMFGEVNERQDGYLRDIWNSGKHLLELVNDILDLSKVEAGQMVLEPSTFSVVSAFEYCLAMVRERAAGHAITVTVEVANGIDTIDADGLLFKRVVLNLLSNAVKFTPQGSVGARVDVAPYKRHPADFVLSSYSATERKELPFQVDRAADAVEVLVTLGLAETQQQFNS